MAYITNADIERRLGRTAYVQLSDDEGAGTADEAVVSDARASAEGEVDSYLARRFHVPVEVGSDPELAGLLAAVTLDVAVHRLHGRRPPAPADVIAAYQATVEWLRGVASGKIALPSAHPLRGTVVEQLTGRAVGGPVRLTRAELDSI